MSITQYPSKSYLGYGLGLRSEHYQTIVDTQPEVDWFEIITENYLMPGGGALHFFDKIRANYPIVMHGVSLSIGSTEALNWDYLTQVKRLMQRIEPSWISDHLCWTGVANKNMHDLLPMPFSNEAVEHVVRRIVQVQEFLGCQILLENVSSYVNYQQSTLTEWEFMTAIAEQADCLILLDVNNIFVSAFNHGFEPQQYLQGIPIERVQQIHLAGHTQKGDEHIIDTHDQPIVEGVFELYAAATKRFGRVSTMIERDDNIPPFEELLEELAQVKKIAEATLREQELCQPA